MSAAALVVEPVPSLAELANDDLWHYVCDVTDPDLTLCGLYIPGALTEYDGTPECVVCAELADLPVCPRCGTTDCRRT